MKRLIIIGIIVWFMLVSGFTITQDVVKDYKIFQADGNESILYNTSIIKYPDGTFDIIFGDKLGQNRVREYCYNETFCKNITYPIPTSIPMYLKSLDRYVDINKNNIIFIKNYNISSINESTITPLQRVIRYVRINFRYSVDTTARTFTIHVINPLKNLWLKFGLFSVIITGSPEFNSTDINVTQETGVAHNSCRDPSLVMHHLIDRDEDPQRDYCGYNNDGVVQGGPTFNTSCPYNNCYEFGVGNKQIVVTNTDSINIGGAITLSAWVYLDVVTNSCPGTACCVICKRDGGGTNYQFDLITDGLRLFDGAKQYTATNVLDTHKWYHVAITVNSSGNASFYVNGTLVDEEGGFSITQNDANLFIGALYTGNFEMEGKIDDVMVFNRTLNSTEISDIYNNVTIRYDKGLQIFNYTFDMKTDRKLNITINECSVTVDATLEAQINNAEQTQDISGCSISNWLVTGSNTAVLNLSFLYGGPFYPASIFDNVTSTPLSDYNTTLESNVTIHRGELGSVNLAHNDTSVILDMGFEINETGDRIRDFSQYHNDGVRVNIVYNTTGGVYNNYYTFDGSNDHITFSDTSSLTITTPMTISLWARFDTTQANRGIISKWGVGTAYLMLIGSGGNTNKFLFDISVGSTQKIAATANTYNDGEWHHIVGRWNGTDTLINVDFDVEQVVGDPTTGPIDSTGGNPLRIGNYNSQTTNGFIGSLDRILIMNRSLTDVEVQSLYNNQSVYYEQTGEFTWKTPYNLGTNTTANITFAGCQQFQGTFLSATINNGTKINLDSNCVASDINIAGDSTEAHVSGHFTGGNYSPVLSGEILSVDAFGAPIVAAQPGWNCNSTSDITPDFKINTSFADTCMICEQNLTFFEMQTQSNCTVALSGNNTKQSIFNTTTDLGFRNVTYYIQCQTGDPVYDSAHIISLTTIELFSPKVSLNLPVNGTNDTVLSDNPVTNLTFNYTVFTNDSLHLCNLVSNFSGTFETNQTNTSSITINDSNVFSPVILGVGDYLWNVECCNINILGGPDVCSFADNNFTLIVSLINSTGALNQTFHPNISQLEWPVNYSLINYTELYTNASLHHGNYTWNFTEYNISPYNLTTYTFRLQNTLPDTDLDVKLQQNQTKPWYEWYCVGINITDSPITIITVPANSSQNINCSLNVINISQSYVNWSIVINKAVWDFEFNFSIEEA